MVGTSNLNLVGCAKLGVGGGVRVLESKKIISSNSFEMKNVLTVLYRELMH